MPRTVTQLVSPDRLAAFRAFFDGRRCVVTGGAGFIGGHLVDALIELGASVVVLDDLSNSEAARTLGLCERHPGRVRFVRGSILDDAALASAFEGATHAFHLAAVCSVPLSVEDPERSWAVNATGTLRVLAASRDAGVQRVVYSASSSAYGNSREMPKLESLVPQPISPYAASKLAGEALMVAFAESYGLSTVMLRYFNIFGPRQRGGGPYAGVIPIFADRLAAGEPPVLFGGGEQTRDFTHVSNAVYANLLAASCDRALTGHVVNIGTGVSHSVAELARVMVRAWGRDDLAPVDGPPRTGDVLHSLADIAAAGRVLGYEPLTGFEDGLDDTVGWLLQHASAAHGDGDAS